MTLRARAWAAMQCWRLARWLGGPAWLPPEVETQLLEAASQMDRVTAFLRLHAALSAAQAQAQAEQTEQASDAFLKHWLANQRNLPRT